MSATSKFAAAFDMAQGKVGRDVAEAILAPSPTIRSGSPKCRKPAWRSRAGRRWTGWASTSRRMLRSRPSQARDVAGILATPAPTWWCPICRSAPRWRPKWYVEQVLEAGCALVNCIPVFIASQPYWRRRFEERGLPIIGDDIKSQVGATIMHRVLTNLFRERGVRLDRTYQLNFGGNTDFMNMLERERLESKKISKTNAVTSQLDDPLSDENAHVGPSDYVPWLADRKWCYIRMEGTTFGNVPLNCEVKLEVWDSPNSAGVVIDAVRCAKLALDRGIGGALDRARQVTS